MSEYREQIMQMLEALKDGYIKRNGENITVLSEKLFSADNPPVIIGTSNSEWCFGLDECNAIIASDWESWGNVSIDVDSVFVHQSGSMGCFFVRAGVEYNFCESEVKYQSYMNLMEKIATSDESAMVRSSQILWFLSHLLHTRGTGERKYIWDLTISGITHMVEGEPKIKYMQFSLPVSAAFPDERMDSNTEAKAGYEKERGMICAYAKQSCTSSSGLAEALSAQLSKVTQLSLDDGQDNLFLGFDGAAYHAPAFMEYLMGLTKDESEFRVDAADMIVHEEEQSFSFCGVGLYTRKLSTEKELNHVLGNISRYVNSAEDKKESLFRLRRDLALALKEASVSSVHTAPFRFEGMGRKGAGNVPLIEYLQLSYPFNWILEQKTDKAINIER